MQANAKFSKRHYVVLAEARMKKLFTLLASSAGWLVAYVIVYSGFSNPVLNFCNVHEQAQAAKIKRLRALSPLNRIPFFAESVPVINDEYENCQSCATLTQLIVEAGEHRICADCWFKEARLAIEEAEAHNAEVEVRLATAGREGQ